MDARSRFIQQVIDGEKVEIRWPYDITATRLAAHLGQYGEPLRAGLNADVLRCALAAPMRHPVLPERLAVMLTDPAPYLDDPVLVLYVSNRTKSASYLIDGAHRLTLRLRFGHRDFSFFQVPEGAFVRAKDNC